MSYKYLAFAIVATALLSCHVKREAEDELAWQHKGDSLVARTFDTLRNTLMRTAGERGFAGAVSFCNIEALRLTNTYASGEITIRRSSDKFRNTTNAPDTMEQRILAAFSQLAGEKKELKPVLKKDDEGNIHYFKPIIVQAMCLNCHGAKDTEIKPDVWQAILQKYPGDLAWGYKEGELRGTWHVTFKAKKWRYKRWPIILNTAALPL